MIWTKNEGENEDSEIKPENGISVESDDELSDSEAVKIKIRKIKDELEKCKTEKAEYLDGWQRCKADSVNIRRDALISAERASNRTRDELVDDVISALDSFDMATGSESWANLDANWRVGMENVRGQFRAALINQGVASYAEVGEKFAPAIHDAIKEIESEDKPETIAQVVRKGYRRDERIIRPAQVVIFARKS